MPMVLKYLAVWVVLNLINALYILVSASPFAGSGKTWGGWLKGVLVSAVITLIIYLVNRAH